VSISGVVLRTLTSGVFSDALWAAPQLPTDDIASNRNTDIKVFMLSRFIKNKNYCNLQALTPIGLLCFANTHQDLVSHGV
jgi:hypothetical protein